MKPSGVQLIMAMVPPGRQTRSISSAVCWWCGANMAPTTERTTSNSPSRNGSASTSASTHSTRTPAACAPPQARAAGRRGALARREELRGQVGGDDGGARPGGGDRRVARARRDVEHRAGARDAGRVDDDRAELRDELGGHAGVVTPRPHRPVLVLQGSIRRIGPVHTGAGHVRPPGVVDTDPASAGTVGAPSSERHGPPGRTKIFAILGLTTARGYGQQMLRVRLVGTVAVDRDGSPVPLPPVVVRLLAYLAVRPGAHPREALAARFWPDTDEPGGRASLRSAVWTLRRAVGDDALVATRSTLGLAPDTVSVDLHEIATLAARGDLVEAVALCGGEALPDIDEDWALEARAEHRARHAALLDQLAESAEAAGDVAGAVRWSRLRSALDPLDEPAHVTLMRRLAAAGDRAGGVVVARDLADRLHGELGLRPGPATRAALAQLLGPVAPPAQRGAAAGRRLPMFGRSAELSLLMRAWAGARDGAGRVVLVTGEAGIGKTRLISEVAQRVSGTGARVAVGAGVDVGGEARWAVWQELPRELGAGVPVPPEGAAWPAELGRLAPDLAAALGRRGAPAPIAAPELERLRIFDAVLRLVEWAAQGRPVLVVAEDVHRADRASLALCAHIGRRLAELPVLFLLTRRDHPARPDADALLADLAGRGVPVDEVELGPLSEAELHAVTRSIALFPDDAVQRVVAAAEGNPLLAVERAKALAAGDTALPATLRAAVRAALGPLPAPARDLADALAVAGRPLAPREIEALAPADRVSAEGQVLQTG